MQLRDSNWDFSEKYSVDPISSSPGAAVNVRCTLTLVVRDSVFSTSGVHVSFNETRAKHMAYMQALSSMANTVHETTKAFVLVQNAVIKAYISKVHITIPDNQPEPEPDPWQNVSA